MGVTERSPRPRSKVHRRLAAKAFLFLVDGRALVLELRKGLLAGAKRDAWRGNNRGLLLRDKPRRQLLYEHGGGLRPTVLTSSKRGRGRAPPLAISIERTVLARREGRLEPLACLGTQLIIVAFRVLRVRICASSMVWRPAGSSKVRWHGRDDGCFGVLPLPGDNWLGHTHVRIVILAHAHTHACVHRRSGERVASRGHSA